jgi:hypothetical protein
MTRGGLSIDQKMVTDFIRSTVKNPDDLLTLNLEGLTGETEKVSFHDTIDYLSRGICLDLQRRERKVETIKTSDLKGSIDSDDPIGYLRGRGYTDKTIFKIFTPKS